MGIRLSPHAPDILEAEAPRAIISLAYWQCQSDTSRIPRPADSHGSNSHAVSATGSDGVCVCVGGGPISLTFNLDITSGGFASRTREKAPPTALRNNYYDAGPANSLPPLIEFYTDSMCPPLCTGGRMSPKRRLLGRARRP